MLLLLSAGRGYSPGVQRVIRATHELDGVADFDEVVRDPSHPTQWLPPYDTGDHLHSSAEGNQRMADSIDLQLFQR